MEKGDLKRRFFIAVFPPEPAVKKLAKLRGSGPRRWEWKGPEDYHISLAFPGPLNEKRLKQLKAVLETVRQPPFDVAFERTGYFLGDHRDAHKKNPHVLLAWPAPRAARELKNLRKEIVERLWAAGFKTGKSDYTPHLTLARVNNRDIGIMKEFTAAHYGLKTKLWRCDNFAIYESLERADPIHPANNNGQGSKFRKIAEFRLTR